MPIARSARKHLQASYRKGRPKKTSCWQTFVLVCMGIYCAGKLVSLQVRLILDMKDMEGEFHDHYSNQTAADCTSCLQRAFDGLLDAHFSLELTQCYHRFGDEIVVQRPYDAKSGRLTESWKDSWEKYGGDWWDLHPLKESPTRFDDRWFFPNWRHQTLVAAGPWLPDYFVMVFLALLGVVVLLLFFMGMPAAKAGLPLTCTTFATLCPYFAYRLAQNYGWSASDDKCTHVHYRIDAFNSTGFWMFVFFYLSVAYAVIPLLNVVKDEDNDTENCASRLFEVCLGTACLVFGLLFLNSVRMRSRAEHEDMLTLWLGGLLLCSVDIVVLFPLMSCLVWWARFDDRVVMYTSEG